MDNQSKGTNTAFRFLIAFAGLVAAGFGYVAWSVLTGAFVHLAQAPSAGEAALAGLFLVLFLALVLSLLIMLAKGRVTTGNAVTIFLFYALAFGVTIVLRDRLAYPDLEDYLAAASNILRHEPFTGRYIYPPLLATLLAYPASLSLEAARLIALAAIVISLWALYALLAATLVRYGFSKNAAAASAFFALAVNTAVWRNLYWGQVNLLVADLILTSILLANKRQSLSALSLAAAVHLKVSPALFALPMLLERRWHWAAWFVAWLAVLAAFTCVSNSASYYFSFLHNLADIYHANPGISFMDNSFDSLIRGLFVLVGSAPAGAAWIVLAVKSGFALALSATVVAAIKHRTFAGGEEAVLLNCAALLWFANLLSPLVWEHHLVYMLVPALLVLPRLSTQRSLLSFGLAWAAMYLVPAFNLYPLSYCRLIGSLFMLWLAWLLARQSEPPCPAGWWQRLCAWLG